MMTTTTTATILFWRSRVSKFLHIHKHTYIQRNNNNDNHNKGDRKGGARTGWAGLGSVCYGTVRLRGAQREWETYTGSEEGRTRLQGRTGPAWAPRRP